MDKQIIKWKIRDLKTHPRQAAMFDDLPNLQLRDLAQDIHVRGLEKPIEILPDGTIVCGHQRTRAVKLLGWDEIPAWINHELAAQGDLAVEQRLIEDNLVGRKMDRLDQIRCYKRLHDMAQVMPSGRRRSHQRGRLRDIIGERLDISGRTLDRYLRVVNTPREVQDAFRASNITLVNASKVAGLRKEAQEQLAADLRAGKDPKQAFAARLSGRESTPFDAAMGRFIRSLEANTKPVEKELSNLKSLSLYDTSILERAHTLIGQMLEKVKGENKESALSRIAEIFKARTAA
jgi:ParB-like chromosome segregation protein Spo0J